MPTTRCKSNGKTDNNNDDEADNMSKDTDIVKELKKINKKLDKLDSLDQRLIGIEQTVQGLVKSQEFLSAQYDLQHNRIEEIKIKVKQLESTNNNLMYRNEKLEKELENNKDAVYDLQQYGRREMLELNGIPSQENERTDNIILDIAKSCKVQLSLHDIEISHRLSARPNATIIVKFNNRRIRNEFFLKMKKNDIMSCDIVGFGDAKNKIYVNDSLCQHYRALFKKCKDTFRPAFKHIWTRNGSIFIRQHDRSQVFKIKSESDIMKMLNNNVTDGNVEVES
jgi:hypothetical protein